MQTNTLVIIDYMHAGDAADAAGPAGKFVQLILQGREYLVFAPKERHRFHNQILAQFLAEQGLPHRWRDAEHLEFDDAAVRVVGGGRFRVDPTARTLELWDDSQAYGRFDEDGLAERIEAAGHAWSAYRLTIG